jgi:predicted histidine transporter YuiF (NhaC family)
VQCFPNILLWYNGIHCIQKLSAKHTNSKLPYLQTMSAKPKLGLFDLTMIVVGLVIGMGIFRTASTPPMLPLHLLFFLWPGEPAG